MYVTSSALASKSMNLFKCVDQIHKNKLFGVKAHARDMMLKMLGNQLLYSTLEKLQQVRF